MNYVLEFQRMMQSQNEIALATVADGLPNVRIVNFYYDEYKKLLYFASFLDNHKIMEFEKNPYVAFTTITNNGEEHIRVKNAVVCKSEVSVQEIKDKLLDKMPEYIMSIPDVLPELILFEVTFEKADVVLDFQHMDTISI